MRKVKKFELEERCSVMQGPGLVEGISLVDQTYRSKLARNGFIGLPLIDHPENFPAEGQHKFCRWSIRCRIQHDDNTGWFHPE